MSRTRARSGRRGAAATPRQRSYLRRLLSERGVPASDLGYIKTLTKREASDFISRLTGEATSAERAGRCSACGRPLRDAESLARGLGPECAKRYA